MSGAPNVIFDVARTQSGAVHLKISGEQLVDGMTTDYLPYDRVDGAPISSEHYFAMPAPGHTKTRQVLPFTVGTASFVLEVNSAQPVCIYRRDDPDKAAKQFKVFPLPGSEGTEYHIARGADVVVYGDIVHIMVAFFNGTNTVFSIPATLFED